MCTQHANDNCRKKLRLIFVNQQKTPHITPSWVSYGVSNISIVRCCYNKIKHSIILYNDCSGWLAEIEYKSEFESTKDTPYPTLTLGWTMGCLLWRFWRKLTCYISTALYCEKIDHVMMKPCCILSWLFTHCSLYIYMHWLLFILCSNDIESGMFFTEYVLYCGEVFAYISDVL